MEITGTPISTVSTLCCAMNFATVPPPPPSTLPSSAVCQITPFASKRLRTYPTYSALASLEPDLPLAPVNLVSATP